MSIHCDANQRIGHCEKNTIIQAGDELYKYLVEVERQMRSRRPLDMRQHQQAIENAMNNWERVKR